MLTSLLLRFLDGRGDGHQDVGHRPFSLLQVSDGVDGKSSASLGGVSERGSSLLGGQSSAVRGWTGRGHFGVRSKTLFD